MASRPQLQSSDSSFDDPLTVQPWRVLVDNLCQNMDQSVYKQMLFFSKDKLRDGDYQKCSEAEELETYFSALEDCLGEDGAVEHLEYSLKQINFHGEFGQIDYKEWIKSYKEAKEVYIVRCTDRGISLDTNFVGRELDLEDVVKQINQDYKGVVLCGKSGIGKTYLAYQVCSRLVNCRPYWDVIVVNQREKYHISELLLDLIYGLGAKELYNADTNVKDLMTQCKILLTERLEQQKKVMIFLDNVDGHCGTTLKQQGFCQVLNELLSRLSVNSRMKLLITIDMELSDIKHFSMIFHEKIIVKELTSMNASDSARLLRKLSGKSETDLPDSVCNDIHSLCRGVPFSISLVGSLVKNGYQIESIVSEIQDQAHSFTNDIIFKKLMDESAHMRDLKPLLARLSVFQTAPFDKHAALLVGQMGDKIRRPSSISSDKLSADRSPGVSMLIKLQQLLLLEDSATLQILGTKMKSVEKLYSFHPLVLSYIKSICESDQTLRIEQESARDQFLKYLGTEIEKLMLNGDPFDTRNKLETNMIHIKEFFKQIRLKNLVLIKYLQQKDPTKHKASKAVQRSRIWKIAELTLSSNEKEMFAQSQAEKEKEAKNLFSYIYWRALEAESNLSLDGLDAAEQLLDSISAELGIVTNGTECFRVDAWNKFSDEMIPAWATFYRVLGKFCYMCLKCQKTNKKCTFERTLQILAVAEDLLMGKDKKYFRSDYADVKHLQGCVFFLLKDFDSSIRCYKKACETKADKLQRCLSEYNSNMAACLHQKALETVDEKEKSRLFTEALKHHEQSIEKQSHLEKALTLYDDVMTYVRNGGMLLENDDAFTLDNIKGNHLKMMKLLQYDASVIDEKSKEYQELKESQVNKRTHLERHNELAILSHNNTEKQMPDKCDFDAIITNRDEDIKLSADDMHNKMLRDNAKASVSLIRQDNFDLPDFVRCNENGNVFNAQNNEGNRDIDATYDRKRSSTSSSRESWSSVRLSTSLENQKRRNTSSSVDSDISMHKRRESWSSAGSRDSVFSQVGHTLDLINLGDDIDEELDIPAVKKKRSEDYSVDNDLN